jgi:multiple sugar transport system permease protein
MKKSAMKKLPAGVPWIAPAVGLLLALSIYPLIYSIQVSFTSEGGGFTAAHYARLFQDRLFSTACRQTAIYSSVALLVEFLLGLGLALLVDSLAHGRGVFRAGLLAPMLLPPVVAAVIWRLIYNPQFGVLNGTLRATGISTTRLTWTSGESTAMLSVLLVDIWEWTPFLFLLLSAGLQAIPQEPYEAARIDGASTWQVFRDVTLPLLKPTLVLALLLRAMDLARIFDQIFILTQGGPGFATETVSLYIYRTAFRFFNFGYAAAMSFVTLALTTLFARALLRVMRVRSAQ